MELKHNDLSKAPLDLNPTQTTQKAEKIIREDRLVKSMSEAQTPEEINEFACQLGPRGQIEGNTWMKIFNLRHDLVESGELDKAQKLDPLCQER